MGRLMLLALTAEPLEPIMVHVGDAPAKSVSFGQVLLSAAGFTLLLVLGAALVGLVLGGIFITINKLKPSNRFNGQRQPEPRLDLRGAHGKLSVVSYQSSVGTGDRELKTEH